MRDGELVKLLLPCSNHFHHLEQLPVSKHLLDVGLLNDSRLIAFDATPREPHFINEWFEAVLGAMTTLCPRDCRVKPRTTKGCTSPRVPIDTIAIRFLAPPGSSCINSCILRTFGDPVKMIKFRVP